MMHYRFFLLLICGLLLATCSKSPQPGRGAIKVNGTWIQASEIEQTAEMLRQQLMQYSPQEGLLDLSDDLRKKTAKQLIAQRIFLQEAQKNNIVCSDSIVDSLASIYKKQFGGDSVFAQLLQKNGQTEAQFRSQLSESFVVDSMMKKLMGKPDTLTEEETRKFYADNPAVFKEGGKIRARHILMTFGKDTSAAAKAELRKTAESVLAQARSGKNFAALAKKFSKDPNAKTGGDIGWFKRGDLMPELETPLFALKLGEVTDIIQSGIGFHILQKSEQADSAVVAYDQVSWKIRQSLTMQKERQRMEKLMDSLMAKANIIYADTVYKP
jgi:parvulin-like peptidyl-prolyl isomerase